MPVSYTALDIITQALIEDGIQAPGDPIDADTAQWALIEFNNLIDAWQALEAYVYAQSFNVFTLTAGLSPHTLGPLASVPAPNLSTGTRARPVKIVGAATLLNTSGTLVDAPIINIRDAAWWQANQTKEIQTNIPTDLYYQPDWPLGSCYFWPVPNSAVQVRLEYWTTLLQYDQINDPLAGPGGVDTLPPGYRPALTYTLAEMLCPGAKIECNPMTSAKALRARAAIFGNNAKSPRVSTQDWGMPKAGIRSGTRSDWNYFTGGRVGGAPE